MWLRVAALVLTTLCLADSRLHDKRQQSQPRPASSSSSSSSQQQQQPWNRPVISSALTELVASASGSYAAPQDKRIPRNLWLGFREIPPAEAMYPHLQNLIRVSQSNHWLVHYMDNSAIDAFMDKFFADTSTLWAYQQINGNARIAAADIWRYCALYVFGGFYMDDDANVQVPLEQIIQPNDSIILTLEGNPYENCYVDSYRLSEVGLQEKLALSQSQSSASSHKPPMFMNGKIVVQWGIFAEPRSPLILRLLTNIVDVIVLEYRRSSVLLPVITESKFHVVLCATGPRIVTATVREYVLELLQSQGVILNEHTPINNESFVLPSLDTNSTSAGQIRIVGRDFDVYGGTYKVQDFKPYFSSPRKQAEYRHFSTFMKKHQIELLGAYMEP